MRLERISHLVYNSPWAILPERHRGIQTLLESAAKRGSLLDFAPEAERPRFEIVGKVAVIPVEGVILGKASGLESACGAFSLETFRKTLRDVAARPDVANIVLNISSGGGTITGLPESAKLIADVSKTKPVYAFTSDCIASAAYWLACSGRGVFLAESAEVGSIGVYQAFLDQTRAFENEGLKVELFKGGGDNNAFKAMGMAGLPLTDDQKNHLQAGVDKTYAAFTDWVTTNRPSVEPESMAGQMFDAGDAQKRGLADGIINELDSLISFLNQ